jgi:hypothetical protein
MSSWYQDRLVTEGADQELDRLGAVVSLISACRGTIDTDDCDCIDLDNGFVHFVGGYVLRIVQMLDDLGEDVTDDKDEEVAVLIVEVPGPAFFAIDMQQLHEIAEEYHVH